MVGCHKLENNQNKRIPKGCEPTMTKACLVLNENTKHENQRQEYKLCKHSFYETLSWNMKRV
jgi:hypothetical protein